MSDATKPTETVEAFKSDPVGPNGLTHGDTPVPETKADATTEVPEAFKSDPVGADGQTQGEAAKAVEEKVNEDEVKITAEPITKGTLGYKAPGLLKQLFYKKYYFQLGEEPVPAKDLSQYLRGEKPDVAHPTAAWSASTGKGLLYFAKTAEGIKTPAGVICLADASEIAKEGPNEFTFKLYKHKHTFETKNSVERDGWLVALKTAAEEAVAARDGITTTPAYQETLADLKKPAGTAAADKDAEHKKEAGTAAAAGGAATAGAAAAVVAEDKKEEKEEKKAEEKKEKKEDKKSRSQSRGKRSSVFGALLGKKDEAEPAKEDKPEEVKEVEKTEAEPAAVAATPAETTAVATGTVAPAPVEEAKPAVVEPEKEEEKFETPAATPATETAPKAEDSTKSTKPNKRASIFGSLFGKKDAETKEEEAAKPVETTEAAEATEVKPAEADKAEEAAATPEVATGTAAVVGAAGAAAGTTAAVAASDKPAEKPAEKRRSSFFGLGGKDKAAKEPTAHEAATEDTKVVETTKQEPLAPVPDNAKNPEETTETKAPKTKTSSKLSDLLRRPSKALKERKAREKSPAPATETVAESAEEPKTNGADAVVKDETAVPATTNGEAPKEAEKSAIGDVVPEAITVGNPENAQQPTVVSASA